MNNDLALEVKNLYSSYDNNRNILNNINFKITKGKITALLGVNGAGKTTLLNTIVGLHPYFNGIININGKTKLDISNNIIKKERFFISDNPLLLTQLTPMEFITFIHSTYNKNINKNRFEELVVKFEFSKYLHTPNDNLSLGNKQKVLLITAFLLDCPLLLLDEPLVGLDIIAIENFYKEIKNYTKNGNSVFLSTHIVELVNNICDEVIILDQGNIKSHLSCKDTDIRQSFFEMISKC